MIKKNLSLEKKENGYVILSSSKPDSNGDVVEQSGWILDEFLQNPVMFYAHNYLQLPIGVWEDVRVEGDYLIGKPVFSKVEEHSQARVIEKLWKEGTIKGASVGFIPIEYVPLKDENGNVIGMHYIRQKLIEVSITPLPAQSEALRLQLKSYGIYIEKKGAIPYKKHPLANEDEKWDASKEVREATVEDLKEMCAWYDEENPDIKTSYKLPHHTAKGYKTVWNGVRAAMAALFGARGGVDIPEKDKEGVYKHLAKHYEEFEKEPPEWKSRDLYYDIYSNIYDIINKINEMQIRISSFENIINSKKEEKNLDGGDYKSKEDIIIIK